MSASRPRPEELRAAAGAVASQGRSPCVAEERLLAFYAGSLRPDEEEEVREHLAVCASCVEVGGDARRFLDAMGERPQPLATRFAWPRALAVAASVTVAVGAVWLARTSRTSERPAPAALTSPAAAATRMAYAWNDVAVVKAPYAPAAALDEELVFRGEDEGEARADEFTRAMEAYARDDFASAERGLAALLARHPEDRRASFYRGVSQLLLGRTKDAFAPLQKAAGGEDPLAADARFYLAVAALKQGDTETARRHLEQVERSSPERRGEARALLDRLRAQSGR